jgi:hypothetical protein
MTLSIINTQHNNDLTCAEFRYAECHILFTIMLSVIILDFIMLSVIMLNVIMLSVIMLNVIILSVVMLSVVAPLKRYTNFICQFHNTNSEKLLKLDIFRIPKCFLQFYYNNNYYNNIAVSFNFFLQHFLLFIFLELPSVGFYQN